MNKDVLAFTHRNLMDRLVKARTQTVSQEEMTRTIIMALADICSALAFDDAESFYEHQERVLDRKP